MLTRTTTLGVCLLIATTAVGATAAHLTPGAPAQTASLRIEVLSGGRPVADASVVVNGTTHRAGADGVVSVSLAQGRADIVVVKEGLEPASMSVELRSGEARTLT